MRSVHLPQDARFTCQSCGLCCQGWSVPVDQATVDRLRAHDWGGGDPFETSSGTGEPFRIRLVNGRCFFLDSANRCRIHSEIAYEAKPPVCRSFPLSILEIGGRQHARLSYWCPTVADNTGKPLEHQGGWLKETAKHRDVRVTPVLLNESRAIEPRDFDRLHQALRRVLTDVQVSMADRLAAAAALVRRVDDAAAKDARAPLAAVVQAAESEGAARLAEGVRRAGHASGGRRALSLFLLQDRRGGRFSTLARLGAVIFFNFGATKLTSTAIAAAATWRQIRRVAFQPPAASEVLLTRYFLSKLDSRRYIAGDATVVTGVNLLLAAYGVINVLARMRAAANKRSSADDDDVRLAVRAADLLVVEHLGLYHGRLLARLARSALGSPDLCRDLFAHIG